SFQSQNCDITLAEGLEEYRAYLKTNGKKQLIDKPGSTIIRDHDATHVMFGLDTSIEQESMLDSWVFLGTKWKLKELLAYNKLPELKQLYKDLRHDPGYFKLIMAAIKLLPIKLKIRKRAKQMNKKWPFVSPDSLMNQRVCDLREEYGIKILSPEERLVKKPLIWSGTMAN
ncbi:hypothetical protein OAK96_00005, partial [Pseudomonadota bacterium]|nr:hypothetical protein [Pseudomonadota bacterium]